MPEFMFPNAQGTRCPEYQHALATCHVARLCAGFTFCAELTLFSPWTAFLSKADE